MNTVVTFPNHFSKVLDSTTLANLSDHDNFEDMVVVLRNLAFSVTTNKPFVIYECHPEASFDLFATVLGQDGLITFIFMQCKSFAPHSKPMAKTRGNYYHLTLLLINS